MQKITTFLWCDNNAEEAAKFYTSIFDNSEISSVSRYAEGAPGPQGSAMSVEFRLDGQDFMAINGGPHFKFSEAISLFVSCEDQAEVDALWQKLGEGGRPAQCGWLKDKYGLSWQIIPKALTQMLRDKDAQKSSRVMQAMLKMEKIDIDGLRRAYEQP
jgi:predicted 3-demethylubiquinone-9 3-methyltransferase (glyoxalase superfamily)